MTALRTVLLSLVVAGALSGVALNVEAQQGNADKATSELELRDCRKHEPNVRDCHIHDRDTFLHLRRGERPAGAHAQAELRDLEREEKSDRRGK